MVWEGRTKVTGLAGGSHGGFVQLGNSLVPPKAEFTFEGDKGSPDVRMLFEIRDDRPECTELMVKAKQDGRGIRSADVQMFNIDTLAVNAFGQLGNIGVHSEDDQRQTFRDVREARASRRGSVTRQELERVAQVYREHVDVSPTRAVSKILGYTERTAARRVQQARDAELLPKTSPGKRKA